MNADKKKSSADMQDLAKQNELDTPARNNAILENALAGAFAATFTEAALYAVASFATNIPGLQKTSSPLFSSGNVENIASLGKATWQRRKDLGWTQKQLAEKSGVGVRFISEFENGKSTAEVAKIFQLLNALDLQLSIDIRNLL